MVCPVCLALPFLIGFSNKLGIHLYITTTLIGILIAYFSFQTDNWLVNLKKKKDPNAKYQRYIPFQNIIILIILFLLVIWYYSYSGMLAT